MNIRIFYNYMLVRLGLRYVLPSYFIRKTKIEECNESIVELSDNSIIISYNEQKLYGRISVIDKLENVASKLEKEGLRLMVYELYRTADRQAKIRNEQMIMLKKQHPKFSDDEIMKLTNKRVSDIGGGHQTGGAVDLTICKIDGTPLDMGTKYLEFNASTETHSKYLTIEQIKNRNLLNRLMSEEGFANYPAEWWHFSYGDKMWAAYSYKKRAFYDVVLQ